MDFLQWPDGALGTALRWFLIALVVYGGVLWVALVAWAYRDIRQRTRDPILQFASVLVVLLFFLLGHWVYLILRPRQTLKEGYDRALEEETLLQELEDQKACASCRRRVQDDWVLCPSCGLQLKEPCATCEKPLSYSWVVCPHCGTEKAPRPGIGVQPTRLRTSALAGIRPKQKAPARRGSARTSTARATGGRSPKPSTNGQSAEGPALRPARKSKARKRKPKDDDTVIDATASTAKPSNAPAPRPGRETS